MASRYSALSSFNSKTSLNIDQANYSNWNVKNILLKQIYSNDKNFYEQEGIEEKAKEILSVGLINHLIVKYAPSPEGAYKLIDGERRWRALNLLVEQGHSKFESVTCRVMSPDNEHEEMIMLITANSSRQKSVTTLIRETQMLKNELKYMKDNGLKLNGYDLNSGRLRDIVASIMNTSKTKIAEYEAVGNNLIDEFKDILDKNNITFSAAYQISKLPSNEQEELLTVYQEHGELTYKYVLEFSKMKKEEHEKEQLPGQMSIDEVCEDDSKNDAPDGLDSVREFDKLMKHRNADVENDLSDDDTDDGSSEQRFDAESNHSISANDNEDSSDGTVDEKIIDSNKQYIVDKSAENQNIVDISDGEIDIKRKIRSAEYLLKKNRNYRNSMCDRQGRLLNSFNSFGLEHFTNYTVLIEALERYIEHLKDKMGVCNE